MLLIPPSQHERHLAIMEKILSPRVARPEKNPAYPSSVMQACASGILAMKAEEVWQNCSIRCRDSSGLFTYPRAS